MHLYNHKLYLTVILVFINLKIVLTRDIHGVLDEFWSISCEFSDVVPRTRRSIPTEPNLEDPVELFDYLYPLADVKLDSAESEQRSAHSISSWMDDIVDLWQSECHSRLRRKKRATSGDKIGDDDKYLMDEYEDDYEPGTAGGFKSDMGNTTTVAADSIANSTAAPKTDKVTKKQDTKVPVKDEDTFFTQYGGDIEYFFPLISFGIPFDGEITFLGFHGFKGLFPYR